MDLVDFAMQMELDGKAHYEKLEQMTPVPGLKKIFSILAADEDKHFDVMKGMREGIILEMAGSIALDAAKNVFQTVRLDETLVASMKTNLDAYRYAIKLEVDSIDNYEEMLKKDATKWRPAEVALLLKIIEEEQKHYNIMENIHDLIAEHDHYLTWREFDKIRNRGII